MPKFKILEFDRDYRTYTGEEILPFDTLKDAKEHCDKISWTGYDYFVDEKWKDPHE